MDCLLNYIGIKGCNPIDPESGLWINELPGINLESVDKIADADQVTYKQVWADVQKRGIRRFDTAVTAYFKSKYKIKKLIDRFPVGETIDRNATVGPVTGQYRGVIITLNPTFTQPRLSPLMSVHLSNIQFYSPIVQTLEFRISDVDGATLLWSETIDLEVGWNDIKADFRTAVLDIPRTLSVGVNASAGTTISSKVGNDSSGGCFCGCIGGNCAAKIEGGTRIAPNDPVTSNDSHGFRLYVAMECSYAGLICASKDLFATALWYLLGAEMMIERLSSSRINKFTTVDIKKAEQLHDLYEARWKEEIELIVDGIDLNDFDCCLQCDPQVALIDTIG